jgi:hypothetical protein
MKELREWIQLLFVIGGGFIALFAFRQNLKQRRVENALKFISLFREGLREGDIANWDELFHSSSELAGSRPGFYQSGSGEYRTIGDYFSEGAPDGQSVARMAAALDVVCNQVVSGVADARTIYYELGQLLTTMHSWLSNTEGAEKGKPLVTSFPSIALFFKKYRSGVKHWPSRVYSFIE